MPSGSTNPTHLPGHSLWSGYAVVMAGLVLQLVTQVGLQQLFALRIGGTDAMDAYVHAMAAPLSLSAMITGTVGPVLITMLGGRPGASRQLIGQVSLILLGLSVLLALLGSLFPVACTAALNPGFPREKLLATANLFGILVWMIPLNVMIGLSQSVLNASWNFLIPSIAGALGPAATVGLFGYLGGGDVTVAAVAVVVGAIVNLLVQLPWSTQFIAWPGPLTDAPWRTVLTLGLPILLGMLFLRIDPLVDRYALSLMNSAGASARQNWAWQIVSGFLLVASGALSTVAFPHIAARALEGAAPLGREIAQALGMLCVLCLPAMTVLTLFAEPLVRDLFERGQFTPEDTRLVARLLQIYAPMILAAALCELGGKTLIALRDSVTPNVVGPAFLAAGFVAKLLLAPSRGVEVLVACTAIAWILSGLVLLVIVAQRVGPRRLLPAGRPLAAALSGTLLATAAGGAVLRWEVPLPGLTGLVLGAIVYFLTLGLLGFRLQRTSTGD